MARTGVPAGAAIPMPCHGRRVLFGPVAVPNWYTMRPCTGQSSWPRSALVIAAAGVAAPRASASRRARSRATMRSFRLFSSRSSSDRRCSASRALRRVSQRRLPLALEGQIAIQLYGALVLASPQHVAPVDERLPLPADAPLQLRHVVRQQAILPAHEIQVLVARQQVAEALRREEHLVPVQRPALRDVHEAPLEHRALLGERVLGEQQVDRGPIDLVRQRIDLAVQLVDDAVGRLFLSLDVRELVGERVYLRAQPLELLLDVRPLPADALQPLLVISELLIEGGGSLRSERRHAKGVAENRHGEASRETVAEVTPFRDACP